jgi:hypothetical protein
MSSVIYASLSSLLIIWLSFHVVKLRRKHRISIGDGNREVLKVAIAAHANAIEYIPIALLLLFALEYNQGSLLLVHFLGLSLVISRLLHARAMLSDNLKLRVFAMQVTVLTLVTLALSNFLYLPYGKLLGS